MADDAAPSRVYHVSRWRYLWIWCVFGPLALAFLGGAAFSHAPGERAGLLAGGACFLVCCALVTFIVRLARLEISAQGVRLKQIGYTLETPWSNIEGLRLDRSREGFVTVQPVGGKGAGLLAGAAGGFGLIGTHLYNDEQMALLEARRFIPIEAFAWHVRHGKLRADIESFAPHLLPALAALDAPPGEPHEAPRPASRPWTLRDWTVVSLIVAFVGALLFIADKSTHNSVLIDQAAMALFAAAFALQTALSAQNCFRRGSRLAGSGLALVSLVLTLWALGASFDFARNLGLGSATTSAFVVLLFAAFTLLVALGSRKAFRKRLWLLGGILALLAMFLLLCTVNSSVELAKALRSSEGRAPARP